MVNPPTMTHNDFDFYEDLIRPLMRFLIQSNILSPIADYQDREEIYGSDEFFEGRKSKFDKKITEDLKLIGSSSKNLNDKRSVSARQEGITEHPNER